MMTYEDPFATLRGFGLLHDVLSVLEPCITGDL